MVVIDTMLKANKFILLISICLTVTVHQSNGIAVMSVDLGSEWVKVAIVKPGVPMEIALNKESRRKTPFMVSINGDERLFSDPAHSVAIKQPKKAFRYLMHLLGKKFDSGAVKMYQQRFPHYNLLKDEKRGTVLFEGDNNNRYSVEELVAMVLNNSRHTAENFAEHPMKDVVLTVPVYYNQAERRALLDACNMTGLNVLQLMNDNTAVALNYGIFRHATFNATMRHVMFYDMGSSHTTATIVGYSTTRVKDRGYLETVPQLVVKGIGFDTQLGGLEMDIRMRDYLVKIFKETVKTKGDITQNPRAMAKLLKEAQRVRQVLSANADHMSRVEGLFEEKDFRTLVTRTAFEEMCQDLFERVRAPVKMALDAAAMNLADINSVVLMGGCTRIPKVQELVKKATQKEELEKSINTDEASALGAVYKAADLIAGFKVKRFLVKDLNLFPVDVSFMRETNDVDGNVRVVTRNLYHRLNPLPQKKVMTFNKKPSDFTFNVSYGDLTFLTDDVNKYLDLGDIGSVDLTGVAESHKTNQHLKPKGVKATFNMDESALLTIEKVEAHFEKSPEQVEEENQSAFAKLGATISDFFGKTKTTDEDDKVAGADKEEIKKTEETKQEEDVKKEEGKKEEKPEEGEKKEEEKKDEKKEEKKSEEKEEVKKEETPADAPKEDETPKTDEIKTNATDAMNATSANATQPTKPQAVKDVLPHSMNFKDVTLIPADELKASIKLLKDLEAADIAKANREKAMNALESFIFDFKDKLSMEENRGLATEEEKTTITDGLNAASEWLDEDGWDAKEAVLTSKLSELHKTTGDVQVRMRETQDRPQAITQLLSSLNISDIFMKGYKDIPHSKEIFQEKDITDLDKLNTEVKTWLMATWAKQNSTAASVQPVLLTSDIFAKLGKLDRELVYLMNKVKYYVPPKPKTEEKKKDDKDKKKKDKKGKGESDETEEGEKKEKDPSSKKSTMDDKPKEWEKKKTTDGEDGEPEVLELGDSKTTTAGDTPVDAGAGVKPATDKPTEDATPVKKPDAAAPAAGDEKPDTTNDAPTTTDSQTHKPAANNEATAPPEVVEPNTHEHANEL